MGLDLSNLSANIISDLGPLLALFGEQVAKQFMSESTGWSDNILFAMAPLGIVTATVGAIRIGGPSWMRAVIGRARENMAVAEIELMSSTSHEVCELWNGQQIVRLMGAPPIREIVCVRRDGELPKLYTLREAKARGSMGEKAILTRKEGDRIQRLNRRVGRTITSFLLFLIGHRQKPMIPDNIEEPTSNAQSKQRFEEAPNISLNLNAHVSRWEIRSFAVVATFMQVSVLVYAHFAASDPSLQAVFGRLGEYADSPWAVHLMMTGTIAVVVGMLLCAFIIEHSTREEQHHATDPLDRVHIMWLQRSAAVSDQSFDSHVIFGEGSRQVITTSRRNQQFSFPGHNLIFNGLTLAGVVVSLVGFLIQMIGFRGMHWTVSVAQLTATALITIIRAWVRRGLSAPPHAIPLPLGYEIDWLATRMVEHDRQLRDRQLWRHHNSLEHPEGPEFWEKFGGQGCYSWDIITGANSPGYTKLIIITPSEHSERRSVVDDETTVSKGVEAVLNNTPLLISTPMEQENPITRWFRPTFGKRQSVAKGIEIVMRNTGTSTNRAQMVLESRKDLGRLTRWSGPAADKATSVAKAIEIVLKNTQTTEDMSGKVLTWNLHAFTAHRETINFEIRHDGKEWKVNVADIEAVLSLWLFAAAEKEKATRTMDDESDKDAWLRSGKASRRESLRLLGASNRVSRRDMKWWGGSVNNRLIEVSPEAHKHIAGETVELSSHRVVGYAGYGVEENRTGGEIRDGVGELRVYRVHEVTDDAKRKTGRWPEGLHKLKQGMTSASDLDSLSEIIRGRTSMNEDVIRSRNSLASDGQWDRQALVTEALDDAEDGKNSLATMSNVPLEAVFAVDIFSGFMWAYAQTPQFKRISGETTVQPPDRVVSGGGATSWQNSTLSRIAENVSRTGLASVEEVYMSIIPPLSAYRRLPDSSCEVEFAKQQAGIYELNADWEKASRCHLWAMDTCEPFDPSDDAAIYATASLTEYLRTLKVSADIMAQQKSNSNDIRWLLKERECLATRLCQFSDPTTRNKIAEIYEIQGRTEGYEIWRYRRDTDNVLGSYGPSMPFKFNRIHLAITSGGFGTIRKIINSTLRRKLNDIRKEVAEIRKEVNEKDVLGWTPLHYAVRGEDYNIVTDLLKWGADWKVQNLAEWTPLHYAASSKMSLWRLIRKDNVNVDQQGWGGFAPLHCAARGNNLLMTKVLIEFGANTQTSDNFRRTPLHWAAYDGFSDIAVLLLEKGANVEAPDDLGRTALHLAAIRGHKDVSEILLASGAEIDVVDRDGKTAVQLAAKEKHTAVIDLMRVRGANMSDGSSEYYSALQAATMDKDVAGAKKLLSAGADVNCKPGRFGSALHAAVQVGHEVLVKLFLSSGARMDVVNSKGETITALEVAAGTENTEIVELLISKGADPKNAAALQSAAKAGRDEIVELLISKGADPNFEDRYGVTALRAAAEAGQHTIVDFLVSKNADPRARNQSGSTALEAAAMMGHDRVIEVLVSKGIDIVHITNNAGETALHTAAREGREKVVQCLLDLGVDINLQGNNGQTALHIAARRANETIVKLLLQNGADPAVKDINDETAIQMAGKSGDKKIVKILLDNVTDTMDKNGEVSLHIVSRVGNEAAVAMLLGKGVDVNFQDSSGETALQVASSGGHQKVVELLLNANAKVDLQDYSGRTALQAAAESGHLLVLNVLATRGVSYDIVDNEGKTALFLAAAAGEHQAVWMLAYKGADINIRDNNGHTALFAAAAGGHRDTLSVLLEYGVDLNSEQDCYMALTAAVNGRHEAVVEQLLNTGVVKPEDGKLLEEAALAGNERIVKLLLDNGANVNASSDKYGSALQAAIFLEDAEDLLILAVVEILLRAGADINAHSDEHCSALQKAALEGYTEVVQLLLDNGADVEVQGGTGLNALQAAVSRGNKEVTQLLITAGADINAHGGRNGTALQAAAASRNLEMTQLLLDNGANANAPGYENRDNALQVALWGGATDIAQLLISYGAGVNTKGAEYGNVLMQAAGNGYVDVVGAMLDNGADLNAEEAGYRSALGQAARNGFPEVVQLLLDRGADVNAENGEYGSALMQAAKYGHVDVVEVLLRYGAVDSVGSGGYKSALVDAARFGQVNLIQAAKAGYMELVQTLLEKAMDVDELRNAQQVAEENGHADVAALILKRVEEGEENV